MTHSNDGDNEFVVSNPLRKSSSKKGIEKPSQILPIQSEDIELSEKSLGFMTVDHPFRKFCLKLVTNPNFETIILLLVLLNIIILAVYDPLDVARVSARNKLNDGSEIAFTVIFSLEMVLKVIAFGFGAYLKDGWNCIDAFIVIICYIQLIPGVENLQSLRALRVFRLFKSLRWFRQRIFGHDTFLYRVKLFFEAVEIVLFTMTSSMRRLLTIGIILIFFLVVFGLFGIVIFSGVTSGVCVYTAHDSNMDLINYWTSTPCGLPTNSSDKSKISYPNTGRSCPSEVFETYLSEDDGPVLSVLNGTCMEGVNDFNEFFNFDNIGTSMLSWFSMGTMEGWSVMLTTLQATFGAPALISLWFIFFFTIMSYFLFNMFAAAFLTSYGAAARVIRHRALKFEQRALSLASLGSHFRSVVSYNPMKSGSLPADADFVGVSDDSSPEPTSSRPSILTKIVNAFDNPLLPQVVVVPLDKIISHWSFNTTMMLCIIGNAILLGCDSVNSTRDYTQNLSNSNLFFVCVFGVEMLLKNMVYGLKKYWSVPFNIFDGIIVLVSVVEAALYMADPDSVTSGGASALRSFRLLRLLRLARSWTRLRSVLTTISLTVTGSGAALIVLLIVILVFALMGMQIFGGHYSETEVVPRGNFQNLWWALVTSFWILSAENWEQTMYVHMRQFGVPSFLFFVALVAIGLYIFANLYMAIIVENASPAAQEAAELRNNEADEEQMQGSLPSLLMGSLRQAFHAAGNECRQRLPKDGKACGYCACDCLEPDHEELLSPSEKRRLKAEKRKVKRDLSQVAPLKRNPSLPPSESALTSASTKVVAQVKSQHRIDPSLTLVRGGSQHGSLGQHARSGGSAASSVDGSVVGNASVNNSFYLGKSGDVKVSLVPLNPLSKQKSHIAHEGCDLSNPTGILDEGLPDGFARSKEDQRAAEAHAVGCCTDDESEVVDELWPHARERTRTSSVSSGLTEFTSVSRSNGAAVFRKSYTSPFEREKSDIAGISKDVSVKNPLANARVPDLTDIGRLPSSAPGGKSQNTPQAAVASSSSVDPEVPVQWRPVSTASTARVDYVYKDSVVAGAVIYAPAFDEAEFESSVLSSTNSASTDEVMEAAAGAIMAGGPCTDDTVGLRVQVLQSGDVRVIPQSPDRLPCDHATSRARQLRSVQLMSVAAENRNRELRGRMPQIFRAPKSAAAQLVIRYFGRAVYDSLVATGQRLGLLQHSQDDDVLAQISEAQLEREAAAAGANLDVSVRRKFKPADLRRPSTHESLGCILYDSPIRSWASRIAHHPRVDQLTLIIIIISTINLAIAEPWTDTCDPAIDAACKRIRDYLFSMDVFITLYFCLELLLKVVAQGLIFDENAYLKDPWNVLDGAIVFVSILSQFFPGNAVRGLRALRALRALRPLRMISRIPGLKLVVNTLLQSFPRIFEIGLVSLLFLYIFAVMGLVFFKGKLGLCTDPSIASFENCTGEFLPSGPLCELLPTPGAIWQCRLGYPELFPRVWTPLPHNYDNIFQSLLTVWELGTSDAWPERMLEGVDGTGFRQPMERDHAPEAAIFFVLLQLLVNWSLFVLFTAVVFETYRDVKSNAQGTRLLTTTQRIWVDNVRSILRLRPRPVFPPPPGLRRKVFRLTESVAFESFIMVVVFANILAIACTHRGMSPTFANNIEYANYTFTLIYALEAALKVYGTGFRRYIASSWHKLDFFLVLASVASSIVSIYAQASGNDIAGLPVASVLRVLRVLRLFRLLRISSSLQTVVRTLIMALPAMGNILSILLLFWFIFAIVGMQVFSGTRHGGWSQVLFRPDQREPSLSQFTNFDSFPHSFMTVFRITTGDDFTDIMRDLMVQEPFCSREYRNFDENDRIRDGLLLTNCGDSVLPPLFFVLCHLFTVLIAVKLFLVAVVDAYVVATGAGQLSLPTALRLERTHLKAFRHAWAIVDPEARGFIPPARLKELLGLLDAPLGLRGSIDPRLPLSEQDAILQRAVRSLPIVLNESNECQFHTVLHALTARAVAHTTAGSPLAAVGLWDAPVKSTGFTLKEIHLITKIQATFRGYMYRKKHPRIRNTDFSKWKK